MVKYVASILIIFVIFCNKDPAGEDILEHYRNLGALDYDSIVPLNIENSYSDLNNGYGANLIMGVDSEYETRILIKFFVPDTGYPDIDSLKLTLKVNNELKNNIVDFEIRLLDIDWVEGEVRWNVASEAVKWQNPGGDYGETVIYEGSIEKDSIIINLDTDLIDDIMASYGFILIPKDGGMLGLEAGTERFYAVSDNDRTYFSLLGDAFIVDCFKFPNADELFLGSGYTFRDFMEFPLDSAYQDRWLVKADLEFRITVDRTMRDSTYFQLISLNEEFSGIKTAIRDFERQYCSMIDTTLSIDVMRIVDDWIALPDSNYGGFLSLYPEDGDVSRIKVDKNSIKLILIFVDKPEGRF